MDPTNPLSVAPPRYKYHPNPETITYFPAYHSESEVESSDREEREAEDGLDLSDEGSDFSDEEDRMPDVKRTDSQRPTYDQSCVNVVWRKGYEQGTLKGITHALIAVNQVAVILSQTFDKYSRSRPASTPSSLQKIGHITIQKPKSSDAAPRKRQPLRKIFSLWTSTSESSSTLFAVQVGRISDRAVHIVSKAIVEEITRASGESTGARVEILDTFIPQTYVPVAGPISQLYLDFPPIRYLAAKKSITLAKGTSGPGSRGIERYESPNYVTGISAGLVSCFAQSTLDSLLLLVPKPVDSSTIVQAIGATSDFQAAADTLRSAFQGADLDWEDINYPSDGVSQKGRRGQHGKGKEFGIIGDGGMYV